jgi:phosphatidylinositol glycan class O
MFVSDAPTTTTQRLTALATGGPPSFFDVSSSFSAGAVRDDNLVDQLAGAGHRLVRGMRSGGHLMVSLLL